MIANRGIIDAVKGRTPKQARFWSRRFKQWIKDRRNKTKTVTDVFTEIYQNREWGQGEGRDFFSGPGSNSEAARPYADFVRSFMSEHGIRSVVDVGCGDYRVGRMISPACRRYVGVDIVESLIEENNWLFGSDTVSFRHIDMSRDEPPEGELCLTQLPQFDPKSVALSAH
jgi:hypothetical protein